MSISNDNQYFKALDYYSFLIGVVQGDKDPSTKELISKLRDEILRYQEHGYVDNTNF